MTIPRLRAHLGDLTIHAREAREAERHQVQRKLNDFFRGLEQTSETSFVNRGIVGLDLEIFDPEKESALTARDRFFRPWSLSKLQKHPKNLDDQECRDRSKKMDSIMEGENVGWPGPATEGTTWARVQYICHRFAVDTEVLPRKGTQQDLQPLKSLTRWRNSQGSPFDEDLRSEFVRVWHNGNKSPYFACDNSWTLARDKPHVKLAMWSGATADPDRVLRSELLAIVAIMLTRLRMETLKNHVVIPVMLFSFVAPRQGRILLAHFNGQKLVVKQSPLYDFRAEDDTSMLLFTRYLAASVDSKGITKSLEIRSQIPRPNVAKS